MSIPDDIERAVAAIHAAPPRLVYLFAGAGSLALYWLHAVGGSSRTVLEARDCYTRRSLDEVAAGASGQAVSAATARAMAVWAADRAAALAEGDWPLLGVACTAAIATDRQRHGADRAWIVVVGTGQPVIHELALAKVQDRLAQEEQVSRLVIAAIAQACERAHAAP